MHPSTLTAATRRIDDLPSPRGLPLLGNLLQLESDRLHLNLEQWARELGTPYTIRIVNKRFLVIDDVEVIQAALRERPHRFRRLGSIEPVFKEMGTNGLFSVEGAAWHPQRRLVTQALAAPNFRSFFPSLHAITQRLLRRWDGAATRGETVEMTHDLMRYTVDVTSALAFGQDPNTLEQDGDVIQDHLALVLPAAMRRIHAPWPWWRTFRLPSDRRLDRALAVIHAYVRDTMQRARRRMQDEPSESPRNLLEGMLAMRDAPGSGITDDDVAANVLTLLIAGEDTTANSLAWALYYLAGEPDRQERLHDQALHAFGGERVCPGLDVLKQLDAFEAAATEATRLRPVAPYTAYQPLEDVRMGDLDVPAGTMLMFLHRRAMCDPRHFENPQTYDPERWTRGREGHAGAHEPRTYLAFGTGPRVCPGRHLAGVEFRLVLSMLLRNFRVELAVPPRDISEVLQFTMMPSAMPVRLVPW